jgi:high affinity choline transporter 7
MKDPVILNAFYIFLPGGEPGLGLPAAIKFPYYDEATDTQKFPFRTLCMLCALCAHFLASTGSRLLFEHGYLEADRWDILNAFPHLSSNEAGKQLTEGNSEPTLSGKSGIENTAAGTDSIDDVRNSKGK